MGSGMSRGPKRKKARHCRYYRELASNGYNTVVDYGSLKDVETAIADALTGPDGQMGYLVMDGFKPSDEIATYLDVSQDMALLISKGKLSKIATQHHLSSHEIAIAIFDAVQNPFAIAADALRKSFQLYVMIDGNGYRIILEFDAVPRGIKNVRAHIVSSIFREKRFRARTKRIQRGWIPGLELIYKKGEGWAALATSSPTDVFVAVAPAVREDLSSSTNTIVEEPVDVKRSKERSKKTPPNKTPALLE